MFQVQAALAVTCTAPTAVVLDIPHHNVGEKTSTSRKNQDRKPAAFVSNEREEKPRVTFESDEAYTCLMAKIEQSTVQSHSISWLVDSACTAHMTFDRSQFSDYKPMQAVEVEMGTKAKTRVAGCGDVVLTLAVNGQS